MVSYNFFPQEACLLIFEDSRRLTIDFQGGLNSILYPQKLGDRRRHFHSIVHPLPQPSLRSFVVISLS
ncbi:MAG: hypothetical protein ABR512_12720 [Desulfopila sp.]